MSSTTKRSGKIFSILFIAALMCLMSAAIIPAMSGATPVVHVFSPPIAGFTFTPSTGTMPLDVTFTDSTTSSVLIASRAWNFGDGTTSAQQNPVHTYSLPGLFTVTMTATDIYGAQDTKILLSAVNVSRAVIPVTTPPVTPAEIMVVYVYSPPFADFTFSPSVGTVPLAVTFLDTSTSAVPLTLRMWEFGDGTTSDQQNPVHTYTLPGVYTVTLTITDSYGAVNTKTLLSAVNVSLAGVPETTITVTPAVTKVVPAYFPPVAGFTFTPSTGTMPLEVMFADTSRSSVPLTSRVWDFGDQTTSTTQNPVHTYTLPGFYTVTLTVTDGYGAVNIKTLLSAVNVSRAVVPETTITVTPAVTNVVPVYFPPVAGFTFTPSAGTVPLAVMFTDTSRSSVPLTSRVWDFGDKTTSTMQNPVHSYSAAGTYTIQLIVADAKGSSSIFTDSITLTSIAPGLRAPVIVPTEMIPPETSTDLPCREFAEGAFVIIAILGIVLLVVMRRKKRS